MHNTVENLFSVFFDYRVHWQELVLFCSALYNIYRYFGRSMSRGLNFETVPVLPPSILMELQKNVAMTTYFLTYCVSKKDLQTLSF